MRIEMSENVVYIESSYKMWREKTLLYKYYSESRQQTKSVLKLESN